MKKKAKFIKLIVIIGIIAGLVYLAIYKSPLHTTPPPPIDEVPTTTTPPTQNIDVTATDVDITEDTKGYTIDVTYPKISGLDDKAGTAINADIKKQTLAAIDEFKNTLLSFAEQDPSLYADDKSILALNYKISDPAHGILGVELSTSQYASGAAHPNGFVTVINYDIRTGKRIELSDLFTPDAPYISTLSSITSDKLTERYHDNWFAEGAEPHDENYQNFHVRENTLTIVFNPYQVASYAAGIVNIDIPLSDLDTILNPAYF